jgi:hypothetical protein
MSRVASPSTAQPTTHQGKIPQEKIAVRAYEKWCKRGQPHGTHVQDWLEAEHELQAEYARLGTAPTRR